MNTTMKTTTQLSIIIAICLLGEMIAAVLPITMPSSIIGMLILAVLLITKAIKYEGIQKTSEFFLANIAILYVPSSITILLYLDLLAESFVKIIFICIATVPVVYFVTAYTVKLVMALQDKNHSRKQKEA